MVQVKNCLLIALPTLLTIAVADRADGADHTTG
jgi:hypothetical protein